VRLAAAVRSANRRCGSSGHHSPGLSPDLEQPHRGLVWVARANNPTAAQARVCHECPIATELGQRRGRGMCGSDVGALPRLIRAKGRQGDERSSARASSCSQPGPQSASRDTSGSSSLYHCCSAASGLRAEAQSTSTWPRPAPCRIRPMPRRLDTRP
jgi:hypothetical protein